MTWDEANEDEELEDLLIEACDSYEKMGQLFTELLRYYASKFDDEAIKLLDQMMGEYILETM